MLIYWYLAVASVLNAALWFYRAGEGSTTIRYTQREALIHGSVQLASLAFWMWLATK